MDENNFSGFSLDIFDFFESLEKNNSKSFFDANRNNYEQFIVKPAKLFIDNIAPFFEQLNPTIRREAKFNKTIMRINKDMRFAKGEPYRTFLLVHFGRFKMDSEFYLFFDKSKMCIGLFLNNMKDENLFFYQNVIKYEKEIISVFEKYKLNNNFSLSDFKKYPQCIELKFAAKKHFDKLIETKFILLEKQFLKTEKICTSENLIIDCIKLFSRLYPLYCFAISPTPLKLIEHFEENLGIAN
ncbi:MAG: hypothetical protein C0425_02860 [Chlorobiaceae bacterium]|nr:hypothetical protein [Chlorobiaceae bacterium]MBA4309261.1 hypothetical protein [Chlorobiaceae bacterium]